ncbi:MAG: gamma carbonic anhydrase family protein [Dehalococcoidia bacterium]|nr:gamma carbonic anhydrase family protein [Dehalococcoidia bacterium]
MIRGFGGKEPKIHPSAFISEACYIVGDVEIGENSSVWPGAVIRADYGRITIGRNSVVQDTCVVHTDDYLHIGDNVSVTHGAVLHGHRVGNNVMIGINAVLLEEAEIGNFCFVGAGAVIRAKTIVPDESLVIGVPAEVRPLSPENRRRLEAPTRSYIANAQAHKREGHGTEISGSPG